MGQRGIEKKRNSQAGGHAHRAYIRGAGPCAAQSQESTSLSRKQLPGHHSAFKERSDTEQDKANPDSQAPSPLPGWPADQALSGQWLRTGGGSGLPLSHTEEEGPLAKTENNMDPELSQRGDVTGQEITVEEIDPKQEEETIQEDSPCEAVRHKSGISGR
ncbi:hypothetical protein DUI87_23872 [Hirundo rustica rustica]|uniref:Uncharacterized protein n=1 Tax=Hirundo rustica rustica TaxID=333673 RepID=A0A3M0JLN8_HIRRU|nr:hypothetical protein DUI87_23872 [Hirundo rustica rustica]